MGERVASLTSSLGVGKRLVASIGLILAFAFLAFLFVFNQIVASFLHLTFFFAYFCLFIACCLRNLLRQEPWVLAANSTVTGHRGSRACMGEMLLLRLHYRLAYRRAVVKSQERRQSAHPACPLYGYTESCPSRRVLKGVGVCIR